MKVRIPRGSGIARIVLGPVGRLVVILFAVFVILGLGTFTFFYAKYSRLTDEKLGAGVFANTAKLFAAPDSVSVGTPTVPLRSRQTCGAAGTANRAPTRSATIRCIRIGLRFSPSRSPISIRSRA